MNRYLTPKVRAWIYGIAIAVIPLLVAGGILSEEDAPLWVALVGAVLVPGMALAHVPGRRPRGRENESLPRSDAY